MSWAFSGSESDNVYQRLNYFLLKRCERLKCAAEVKYAFTDTCCGGCKDRSAHWFAKCWPSAKEAPFKDIFHGQKKLFDATYGSKHPLHHNFVPLVKQACLKYDEESSARVLDLFQREHKNGRQRLGREIAQKEMLKKSRYTKRMLNYVPGKAEMLEELEEAIATIKIEEDALKQEAESKGDGYVRYLLKEVKGKILGFENTFENMKEHIKKGCYDDPMPPEKMSVCLDPDDVTSEKVRLQSFNHQVNNLVKEITRMTATLAHKKLWLRVTRYNLDKDRKLAKLLGIQNPRTLEWFLHEALIERHPGLSLFKDMEFPPDIEGYDEPIIGKDYLDYSDWEKIDQAIAAFEIEMGRETAALLRTTGTLTDRSEEVGSEVQQQQQQQQQQPQRHLQQQWLQ